MNSITYLRQMLTISAAQSNWKLTNKLKIIKNSRKKRYNFYADVKGVGEILVKEVVFQSV